MNECNKKKLIRFLITLAICVVLFYGLPYVTAAVIIVLGSGARLIGFLLRNLVGIIGLVVMYLIIKNYFK